MFHSSRRLHIACAFGFCLGFWWPSQEVSADDDRPNILFFLVDDQRNDTLGCAGHPILETPTVDRLAETGVRFANMFVTTSICAASRASIFTSLHERTHRFTFGTPPISELHTGASYPAVLRKHGYRTGFIGKFGVGVAGDGKSAMFDYFQPIGRNPYLKKQPDGTLRHESELAGDRAIEFLQSNPTDRPFCLSVSFNAVHAEDADKRPGIGHYPWP
ncbi:MAG: sulfatase-like hydrolase/transferase, partial [Planctomycetes bacterium]|nr:sulfatase-like hydrolase/transferase [Planctomycetota bacterium]